jgi:hypothetical protein
VRFSRALRWLPPALLLALTVGPANAGAVLLRPPAALHARILPAPVSTVTLSGGAVTATGEYTVTPGYPAHMVAVSPTGAVRHAVALHGAYGAWGFVAAGGEVYAGTHPNGIIFAMNQTTGRVSTVCRLKGVNTVWSMAADPVTGRVYAGTYPDGGVWQVAPGGCRRLAAFRAAGGPAVSVRSLGAYGGTVYAGLGPEQDVRAISPSGRVASVLPAAYRHAGQVDRIAASASGLEVLLDNGDLLTLTLGGRLLSVLSSVDTVPLELGGRWLSLRGGVLYALQPGVVGHLLGGALASVPATAARNLSAWGIEGQDLVGLTSHGELLTVNPAAGSVNLTPLFLPAAAGVIETLAAAPDGVWGSAYLGGQVFHLAADGTATRYDGLPQVDSIVPLGSELYFGAYPNAQLYAYDPAAAWNPGQNPRLVASAGDPQDRPFALAAAGSEVYMGTVPKGGHQGGSLIGYNVATHAVHRFGTPVARQSVVSLAVSGDTLVGGTSVYGGLGSPRAAGDAYLFAIDLACDCHLRRFAVPGQREVSGLWASADGSVYGLSDDAVIRLDLATGAVTVKTFSHVGWQAGAWGDTQHLVAVRSDLFAVVNGNLMRVNPATLAVHEVLYGVEQAAAADGQLFLSYRRSTQILDLADGRLVAYARAAP